MSTSLRLALIVVTLSLFTTVAWLATGDQIHWDQAGHALLARL